MNLDLKKTTKEREKETFEHLVGVLFYMFSKIERLKQFIGEETESKYNKRIKKQDEIYKEAKDYLASYIEALINN